MKKYFIFLIFTIYGLTYHNVFCGCEYQSEIDKCVQANKDGEGAKNITDFVCKETTPLSIEGIAYQVIFDMKFKEIDKDVENFLDTLQNSIQYYYGPEKKETFIDGINYINELFDPNGSLSKRYKKYCQPGDDNSIIKIYHQCTNKGGEKDTSTIIESQFYISGGKGQGQGNGLSACKELVDRKLFIYKKVAYNLLQVNKLDFLKDYRKKQVKATRETYDKVIGNMYTNLDYIITINKQREKVTEQCQYIAPGG